jgi:hypothetical protein
MSKELIDSVCPAPARRLEATLADRRASHRARWGSAGWAGGRESAVCAELTDALVREDRVEVRNGLAEVTGRPGGGPVSLAAAIEDRLGFVSAETLEVLRIAALLGARFSVRDLMIVAGRGARELAGLVREAVADGVLVESGQ